MDRSAGDGERAAILKYAVGYPALVVAAPTVLAVFEPAYGVPALLLLTACGGGYFALFGGDTRGSQLEDAAYHGRSSQSTDHTDPSSPLSHPKRLLIAGGVAVLSVVALVASGNVP